MLLDKEESYLRKVLGRCLLLLWAHVPVVLLVAWWYQQPIWLCLILAGITAMLPTLIYGADVAGLWRLRHRILAYDHERRPDPFQPRSHRDAL